MLVFWLFVIFVTPPPAFEYEATARRSGREIRPNADPLAGDGDALVICDVDTPFADVAGAARGQLAIAVHKQQAPLACEIIL